MHADIPKIIHQIWVGPNEIPPQCLTYINTVKTLHPKYEHILWTNDNLPPLPDKVQIQMEKYGKNKKWAFQCDVLRYYLLNEFGGIYLDVDFEVKKNLTPLMTKPFNITLPPYRKNHVFWVCNGAFGTEPNNPILIKIIQTLKDEIYHGPIFFGNEIKKFIDLPATKEITAQDIFDKCVEHKYIHCMSSELLFREYAVHHALKSWLPTYKL